MKLKGRRILVTGAAQGIGLEIATLCTTEGGAVALIDLDGTTLASAAAGLRERGFTATGHAADVTDFASLTSAVEEAERALGGPLDGIVINAGVAPLCDLASLTPEAWDRVIRINLDGSFYTYKACEASLLRSDSPRKSIAIVSSGSAFSGSGAGVHYAASKAGQIGMMRGLARALGDRGITVNAIAPRTIRTKMLEGLYASEEDFENLASKVLLKRMGTAEDIAGVAAFLLSEESSFIHGQTIIVDGGRGLS